MHKLGAITATLAITAGSVVGAAVAAAPPAAATAPVAMGAVPQTTWQTNGIVWALAAAKGTVFAGGTFSSVRPSGAAAGTSETSAVNFASFNAATGAPAGCKLSFTITSGTATVRALAVSPDGRTLYAGGWFGAVNGVKVSSLAAIDIASCTVSTTFHPSFSATVRALSVSPDSKTVYAGGDFQTVNSTSRKYFAAVGTTGTLTAWNPTGDKPGRALAVTPDGENVAIGGDFTTVGGTSSHALAVVSATTGSLTKAYPKGFIDANSVVKAITMDPATNSFYTGNEGTGSGVFDGRMAISLSDFSQRWRDTCLGATQALQVYKSVLYVGAHVHDCSDMGEFPNQKRKHLVAEPLGQPTLLGWTPDTNDGLGEGIGPRAMTEATSGSTDYLWVGGEFTTVDGVGQQGLTRFSSTTDAAPSVPYVNVTSSAAGAATVRWQPSLDADDSSLTYRIYRDGGSTPVDTVTVSSLPWSRPQQVWTDTGLTPGSTHTYRITASDGTLTSAKSTTASVTVDTTADTRTPAAAYAAQVLADGADLYWRYDETAGTYAADQSTANDSGIHVGGPTRGVSPGLLAGSTAVTYHGTDAVPQWTYSDKPHAKPGAYTLETWFESTSTTGGEIVGDGSGTSSVSKSDDRLVYLRNDGRLTFGVNDGTKHTLTTSKSYNDGKWHQVVATESTTTGMRLYVDGKLQTSTLLASSSGSYTGYWHVGGDTLAGWSGRPTSDYFSGTVDETAVYPSVLSATQISKHYTLGTSG
jgi:hypothetical protein